MNKEAAYSRGSVIGLDKATVPVQTMIEIAMWLALAGYTFTVEDYPQFITLRINGMNVLAN